MELSGLVPGEDHNKLVMTGATNLDGTLDLVRLVPYSDLTTRITVDDFAIVNAGRRNGTFNTVQDDGSTLAPDVETDGDGDRNAATAVPEPSGLLLLVLASDCLSIAGTRSGHN